MNTQGFYADLPALTRFFDSANADHYAQAPDDWYVLITDITNSTGAIADGQYKDVNLIGASSIIAVLNKVYPLEIPFVFGGDGATLLVPPNYLQAAREALLGVRAIARQRFGLELRVGIVPVSDINPQHPLKVAKFSLSPLHCQASFIGGGITYATELVKQRPIYQLAFEGNPEQANLTGLECRWQEIPAPQGNTLSLIVTALHSSGTAESEIYQAALTQIQAIFGDPQDYHPITEAALQLSFNPRKLDAEVKARARSPRLRDRLRYRLQMLLENLLGAVFMRWGLTSGEVDWGNYKTEVRAATDYQKMDDVLRMVITGSSSQIQQLIQYLEWQSQQGHLAYGLHVSDRALLTCLIFDRRNRHFHLIDGADGGYALAAKDLKVQLHQKAKNWKTYANIARQRGRSPNPKPQF